MPVRPHQVLSFLVELEDDPAREHALNSGFDVMREAAVAGLIDMRAPHDHDGLAAAIDDLVRRGYVELSDMLKEYRPQHARFDGNALTNSRDVRVTPEGRALELQVRAGPAAPSPDVCEPTASAPREVASDGEVDFFVSYNSADRGWAEWLAWQLEGAGYSTFLQEWDFVGGSNFVLEMDRAAKTARRTIAVLSPAYLAATFPQPEWAAALRADPTGAARKLVPVRVAGCEPEGLLGSISYIDLVGLDEADARNALLARIKERAKPSEAPAFPGATAKPDFPGDAAPSAPAPASPSATESRTFAKLNQLVFVVEELEDDGTELRVTAMLSDDEARYLDRLADGHNRRVRFVYGDRVVDARLARVRHALASGERRTTVELERAEPARTSAMRAGTGGYTADDLIELGLRELILGEPLPHDIGLLASLADPGIDRAALREAAAAQDAEEAIRLVFVEALVGGGHASAITDFRLGPDEGGEREVVLEWEEPESYVNVPTSRRRLQGRWQP